jgi:hypothetical protein
MYITKSFVRVHKLSIAIVIFLLLFSIIHSVKPALLYTPDGGFRQFGVGYKQKTVVPIWLVAIILAIFSYLGVLYYLMSS